MPNGHPAGVKHGAQYLGLSWPGELCFFRGGMIGAQTPWRWYQIEVGSSTLGIGISKLSGLSNTLDIE
jgi:hypothetical protein